MHARTHTRCSFVRHQLCRRRRCAPSGSTAQRWRLLRKKSIRTASCALPAAARQHREYSQNPFLRYLRNSHSRRARWSQATHAHASSHARLDACSLRTRTLAHACTQKHARNRTRSLSLSDTRMQARTRIAGADAHTYSPLGRWIHRIDRTGKMGAFGCSACGLQPDAMHRRVPKSPQHARSAHLRVPCPATQHSTSRMADSMAHHTTGQTTYNMACNIQHGMQRTTWHVAHGMQCNISVQHGTRHEIPGADARADERCTLHAASCMRHRGRDILAPFAMSISSSIRSSVCTNDNHSRAASCAPARALVRSKSSAPRTNAARVGTSCLRCISRRLTAQRRRSCSAWRWQSGRCTAQWYASD